MGRFFWGVSAKAFSRAIPIQSIFQVFKDSRAITILLFSDLQYVLFTGLSQDLTSEIHWLFQTKFGIFFCGSLVELRKKFANTRVSVYQRGVSITTKWQLVIYIGQNRKIYWLCRRFPWLILTFLTDNFFNEFFLTFLTCDIPDFPGFQRFKRCHASAVFWSTVRAV